MAMQSLIFCYFVSSICIVTCQYDSILIADPPVDGVQEIILPMCRNFLSYNWTKLPNRFGHDTQVEVYRNIQHLWAYMDYGCSKNFRLFICSLHLPKYDLQTQTSVGPCKETCNRARNRCKKPMRQTGSRWPRKYRCSLLPSRRSEDTECLVPIREPREVLEHTYCVNNSIPLCQGLNTLGSLPNFFLQRSLSEISTELRFYDNLVASGCNPNLQFFLCGTYLPFCVPNITPFATPCMELCNEIKNNCSSHFDFIYRGLPWPNKLQCHRYTNSTDTRRYCAMPGDL